MVGNVLTAFFAQKSVAGFDGITDIKGGWLDRNWIQLAYQVANSAAGMAYSFIVTVRNPVFSVTLQLIQLTVHQTIILWVMHFIPFLCLRCDEDTEIIGVDDGEMGEFAYDYVGVEVELGPRHMYGGDIGEAGVGREPEPMPPHNEVKTSLTSEQRSDVDSQYPLNHALNHFPMKAIRG